MNGYVPRLADTRIRDLLTELPAILITGPRATGKTTTARRFAKSVVRLDREAEAAAFRADPDIALRGLDEPILLDEWQEVPAVLGAVKRAVDDEPRPGRFLLTGSVRADLENQTWPCTGRLVRVNMQGLCVRESEQLEGALFLERVLAADASALQPAGDENLSTYVQWALRGGFPEPALRLSEGGRRAWLESYVDQLITRDAAGIGERRDPDRLRRYLQAICLNSAGVVAGSTIFESAGVDRKTANAYERLLTNLLVLEAVPAWHSNRLSRLIKMPKRYMADTSLIGAIAGFSAESVMRDGDVLGRLLDNFVFTQLRVEANALESLPRIYHLRDKEGRHEIDLLIEYGGGQVVALKVKASAAPGGSDARHLTWLRDELGDRFVAGVVLHTGPRTFALGDRVFAAPISTLWG